MSEQKVVAGRIRRTSLTIEQAFQKVFDSVDGAEKIMSDWFTPYFPEDVARLEFIRERGWFIIVDGVVWEKVGVTEDDPEFFFQTDDMPDGFTFSTSFHNGDTCLDELLEDHIREKFS